ncbi:hypothetical protein L6R52_42185 [Myxococcota bacterium]|nr:hypothetical protein [Myxococcota bacterium]
MDTRSEGRVIEHDDAQGTGGHARGRAVAVDPARPSVLVLALVSTVACQGRGLVDEGYPGHALGTAEGSLAATAGPVREPVSLAIAWLPSSAAAAPLARIDALLGRAAGALSHGTGCTELPSFDPERSPYGLVAEPVSHTSALPFQFKFTVLSAPPREAELGRDGRASLGLVIAYVDRDDSGTFARDPAAPDRIVGLSADRAKTQLLVFLEGSAPAAWADASKALAAAPPGFSVVTLAEDAKLVALDDAFLELSPDLIDDGRICP